MKGLLKNIYRLCFFISIIGFISCSDAKASDSEEGGLDLPFDMPKVVVPEFNADTFNIVDYGAISNGKFLNTGVINSTIDLCSKNNGGVVLIPKGVWLTGPVVLKDNVNIHLEGGALLQFSGDRSLYPLLENFYEGKKNPRCQNPISGKNLKNIAITGKGVIDGDGGAWRQIKKDKLTEKQWKETVAGGGFVYNEKIWYPSESYYEGEQLVRSGKVDYDNVNALKQYKDFFRPQLINLIQCENILLDGPTFQNSPSWNIHPLLCKNITVRNINVRNPWFAQNGDGIDLESCKYGIIENCTFDVGDDAICIKSGKDKQGRDIGVPTECVIVRNCIVYHGHGGFVIGSEMSGGVKNMYVENCTFLGTDCGLRFKSTRGRGGVVENIYIKGVRMTNIPTDAIRFNLYYGGKIKEDENGNIIGVKTLPVSEETPCFRNFVFEDIQCFNVEKAITINGIPEMPVQNIIIKNSKIVSNEGVLIRYAKGIELEGLSLDVNKPESVIIQNSDDVKFSDSEVVDVEHHIVVVKGESTGNVYLDFKNVSNAKKYVKVVGTPDKNVHYK